MTTGILSRGTATKAYTHERISIMDRADRIGRLMFKTRCQGNPQTALDAAEIVDAEIDQQNIKPIVKKAVVRPALKDAKPAYITIVTASQTAANDDGIVKPGIVGKLIKSVAKGLLNVSQWLNNTAGGRA